VSAPKKISSADEITAWLLESLPHRALSLVR
jgi:hypothetical protein